MSQVYTDVEIWLRKRPKWLQTAANKLIKNNNQFTNQDIKELVELCKLEAISKANADIFKPIHIGSLAYKDISNKLHINKISDIQGVNALGPKKPLVFHPELSIIYGLNGSGKSSYVRLLKKASGTKQSLDLIGDVYSAEPKVKKFSIEFTLNDCTQEFNWTKENDFNKSLSSIQLYDTECANIYVNNENEVTYEPWILQFFSNLTSVCILVGESLREELTNVHVNKSDVPYELSRTKAVKWMENITKDLRQDIIDQNCEWKQEEENRLNELRQRLNETDTAGKIEIHDNIAQVSRKLHKILEDSFNYLNDGYCTEIVNTRVDYLKKKKVAEEDATKIFNEDILEGVGTESWKILWESARRFSEEQAYPNFTYPNTTTESKCVLCHQPLDSQGQERLESFEVYIKNSLNNQARESGIKLNELLTSIPEVPDQNILSLHLKWLEKDIHAKVEEFCKALKKRKDELDLTIVIDDLTPLPSTDILNRLILNAEYNEGESRQYKEFSEQNNRMILVDEKIQLEGKKWVSDSKMLIEETVRKLKLKDELESAIQLTNTKAISLKKSTLAEQLITRDYIQRFEKELKELGGDRINVKLEKTKTKKGQVYHQIKLKNAKGNIRTSDVLSEGEFRIVSLAGFIADVEGTPDITPFVFDDPISSLDQGFEEATVKRLAKLSLTRQVIVFTHRISLLTLLESEVKSLQVPHEIIWISKEPWGAGEPRETPLFAKKPDKALNTLLNDRLSRAEKVYFDYGRSEYDILAKSICSDFRILIERIIENDLLFDVVQRFRRSINTMGKLNKLSYITEEDCKLIDSYMTKYSIYEHSQSDEAPVQLPAPEELRQDMNKLKEWLAAFKARVPK